MQAPTSLASGMSSQSGNVMTGIGQPTTLPVGPGLQVIAGVTHPQAANEQISPTQVQRWIQSVGHCMDDREIALGELSKKREAIPDLATMLWNAFGVVSALLQEVIGVYPAALTPSATITPAQSNRVCNALALLQCLASHPETRPQFLKAQLPIYLFPLLRPEKAGRHFEYIRLTSLGVIGALVKADDPEVIAFLLNTEILPLCLKIMECGSELSRTVATFILQKVLLDDQGLQFVCHPQFDQRLANVHTALAKLVQSMLAEAASQHTARLLKHVIRCYMRLSENPLARDALNKGALPDQIRDVLRDLKLGTGAETGGTATPNSSAAASQAVSGGAGAGASPFSKFAEDPSTKKWLTALLRNLDPLAMPTSATPLPPGAPEQNSPGTLAAMNNLNSPTASLAGFNPTVGAPTRAAVPGAGGFGAIGAFSSGNGALNPNALAFNAFPH